MPVPRPDLTHLGTFDAQNGIDGHLLDQTLGSEQPPNSSTIYRFGATSIPIHTQRPAPEHRRRKIIIPFICFLTDVESLYGYDPVTRNHLPSCKPTKRAFPWFSNDPTPAPL